MKMRLPIRVLATFTALILFSTATRAGEISIDISRPDISTLKQGIVNGPNHYSGRTPTLDAADKYIAALKFSSWRFSGMDGYGFGGDIYKFIATDYQYNTRTPASMVVNLQDVFNARYGRPVKIQRLCAPWSKRCFTSFEKLRKAWNDSTAEFLSHTEDKHIDYFDLLGEPDLNSFKNVPPEQIYALMKDLYNLVKQRRPDVKIVTPSVANFNPQLFENLLRNMLKDNIRFDALSWHELGHDPALVGQHVEEMNSLFRKYPAICTPVCPEIHINEYQGEDTMLIPGHAVAWLQVLEAAGIAQANRACWGGDEGSPIPYQSCWEGFSGLLMPDYSMPQPLYWVYKYYADLNGSRLLTSSTAEKISALSGRFENGNIGILVGNYGTKPQTTTVRLSGYLNTFAQVEIYKIGNTFNKVVALPSVEISKTLNISAEGTTLSIPLEDMPEGDAWWVVITPSG